MIERQFILAHDFHNRIMSVGYAWPKQQILCSLFQHKHVKMIARSIQWVIAQTMNDGSFNAARKALFSRIAAAPINWTGNPLFLWFEPPSFDLALGLIFLNFFSCPYSIGQLSFPVIMMLVDENDVHFEQLQRNLRISCPRSPISWDHFLLIWDVPMFLPLRPGNFMLCGWLTFSFLPRPRRKYPRMNQLFLAKRTDVVNRER